MVCSNPTALPQWLLSEGISIIGTGLMGTAYATRLSQLRVPVTIFNRTTAKALEVAKALPDIQVADSLLDCVHASRTVVVACSPTHAAIASVCEQMRSAAQERHIIFIVDSGLREARIMEEVLFEQGGAASVTNVAMFGWAGAVVEGSGALINASGRTVTSEEVADRVLPLLGLFGKTTYHAGGTATAAHFAMAGHMAFMPIFYALMHYVALMRQSGVDPAVAVEYFQATSRTCVDGLVPLFAPTFQKRDYSEFGGSHRLIKDIQDLLVETCKTLTVDHRLAQLMSEYHERALADRALAAKSFHSVYEVICPPHRG